METSEISKIRILYAEEIEKYLDESTQYSDIQTSGDWVYFHVYTPHHTLSFEIHVISCELLHGDDELRLKGTWTVHDIWVCSKEKKGRNNYTGQGKEIMAGCVEVNISNPRCVDKCINQMENEAVTALKSDRFSLDMIIDEIKQAQSSRADYGKQKNGEEEVAKTEEEVRLENQSPIPAT